MQQNIPTPWAVAAIDVVLLVVGLIIWRGMSPRALPPPRRWARARQTTAVRWGIPATRLPRRCRRACGRVQAPTPGAGGCGPPAPVQLGVRSAAAALSEAACCRRPAAASRVPVEDRWAESVGELLLLVNSAGSGPWEIAGARTKSAWRGQCLAQRPIWSAWSLC